ncbi:MAG: hypothetical protein HC927_02830 [Deltaproteobacteria bacterium]|nr:hypothetical protein [Deltaproteobacteria bacterium]
MSEQSLAHVITQAEDLANRGVRRLIAVFVRRGEVCEWSQDERRFVPLPLDGTLEDRTLLHPIAIDALLDAVAADSAVVDAIHARRNPRAVEIEEAARFGPIAALCKKLRLPFGPAERARLHGLDDDRLADVLLFISSHRRWP